MGTIEAGARLGHGCVDAGSSSGARATVLCCAPVRGCEAWGGVSRVIVLGSRATLKATRALVMCQDHRFVSYVSRSQPEQRHNHSQLVHYCAACCCALPQSILLYM
jgi:hypothetical protein